MRLRTSFAFVIVNYFTVFAASMWAQDLGPHFRKIKEGIYVQTAREVNSNVGIILTKEGVVIIDTGQTPIDSREVQEAVKKLTTLPVRLVINTEVHPDHTTGNFVFSPPAIVINHQSASEAMRKAADPNRARLSAASRLSCARPWRNTVWLRPTSNIETGRRCMWEKELSS